MTDQPIRPPLEAPPLRQRPLRVTPRPMPVVEEQRPAARPWLAVARLDMYLLIVVGGLLAIGMMMVYSTTFDWSFQTWGSETTVFFNHVRNALVGAAFLVLLALVDYRRWRRFAVLALLATLATLVAVLLYGDDTFGARRSLIGGSFQPVKLAAV